MRTALARPAVLCASLLLTLWSCKKSGEDRPVTSQTKTQPLFTLLTSGQTNILFENTLDEGLNTNILVYEYFYNGGGVAAGDVNGDGLTDLYFTANMSGNSLYLNKGGMKFEDVTQASGTAGREGPWKTGVTLVDINADNKLDLYVSYSGMLPEPKRANQLFVNQGNDAQGIPHFEEQAEAWGLASTGFSNQGHFFDYDRDGDLDMLLLNHNPKSLPILDDQQNAAMLRQDDPFQGLRLFQQNKGTFTDITSKAGIFGSPLSYGLGLGIADMNMDGWPDFYVSNDYAVPDYLYINQKNGTFRNTLAENIGHSSQFSMGNDVGDINNDGLPDIVTLDMLPEDNRRQKLLLAPDNYNKFDLNVRSGFHYQYMRNMLQLNNGNGTFSEIGQFSGISNTDWSWSALLADYDNDGWKDLHITNGYFRDFTNLDFTNYLNDYVKSKGRLQREDLPELIRKMPSSNVVNYLFSNQDGLRFTDRTREWGLDRPSNSNGAAYADLDNDGDLDLIVNNINQPAFIYQNEARQLKKNHYLQVQLQGSAQNTQGIGAKVRLFAAGKEQSIEQYSSRGYLSAVSPLLHFGLGETSGIDSLSVTWVDGKQQVLRDVPVDQRITLSEKDARSVRNPAPRPAPLLRQTNSPIPYRQAELAIRDFNRQSLLLCEMSFCGPVMVKGDLDGDGREDVFIGAAAGQAASLYLQKAAGRFTPQSVPAFEADKACTDADAAIFDANGDGHPDIYVASGGYHQYDSKDKLLHDRLYFGDGKGGFTRAALPELAGSKGAVAVGDANQDGYPDLFVGGRVVPGRYPESPASYLLINDGKGGFSDQTAALAPDFQQFGMVTDAAWADLNQDGKEELVVTGEWQPISVFAFANGKMENQSARYFSQEYKGWWNTLRVADVNQDQKPDLIVGNMGLNTQFRASDKEPLEMYYRDFDNNGSVDPVFCYYIQGASYPYVTRDEMLGQLTSLRARYNSYESYANARLSDIFSAEDIAKASHLEANHMETTLFLNQGGSFTPQSLPAEAQYAPVYAIEVLDVNQDQVPDLLLCGNNSHFKLRLGRFDANYGTLLIGKGQGNFEYVPQTQSGLQVKGDVRSLLQIGNTLLFGVSQGAVVSYQIGSKGI